VPGNKTLPDIVNAINSALEVDIAGQSGSNIRLTLPAGEEKRRLNFALPDGPDATKTIFGIIPPRSYESKDAASAKVTGKEELIEVDLQTSRSLRIAVDDRNLSMWIAPRQQRMLQRRLCRRSQRRSTMLWAGRWPLRKGNA